MLTSELIRPRLRIHGSNLRIEMVNEQDPSLQQKAHDLICLFNRHRSQSQAAWEEAVRAYEGTNVDYVFIRGLAKVLTDAAIFKPLTTPLPPTTLREHIFSYGPVFEKPDLFHPTTRQEVLRDVADTLELSLGELDEFLFADRGGSYRLMDPGPAWTPVTLLARYNLELARGALYWASHIIIEVSSNYKDLWKFIKLFKLMFWAEPARDGGYRIDLDGPISPFVSSTLDMAGKWQRFSLLYFSASAGKCMHTCVPRKHREKHCIDWIIPVRYVRTLKVQGLLTAALRKTSLVNLRKRWEVSADIGEWYVKAK